MYNLWEFLKTRWCGQLMCAFLFWAIAAFCYWNIGRHEHVPFFWIDLIVYGVLGKWGWVYVWGFFAALFTFVGVWNLAVTLVYGESDDE